MDLLAEASWFRALELDERLASLRHARDDGNLGSGLHDTGLHDPELAARRIATWRAPPLDDDAIWHRRLSQAGISPDELLRLSGEPPEALQARSREVPVWLREIGGAYRDDIAAPFDWPDPVDARQRSPFLPLAEPLVRAAFERLIGRLRVLAGEGSADGNGTGGSSLPFEPVRAARTLLSHLPEQLTLMLSRVLVVELHVAKHEDRLPGDTPQERFETFRQGLYRRETALDILARYPVLARALVERLEQWEEVTFELFRHLAADAPELWRRFAGGETPGPLIAARGGLSDPHHGGRSVFILRFESGLQIVYKPRPLAAEKAFQDLLAWINAQGFTPPFATLEVFDAGDHGWMEHVEAAACETGEELRRFFLRQGAYLALLHLLDGTDIHHENTIAAGEHPSIVDLETLFHPPVDGASLHGVQRLPGAPLRESVLASGLLPQRIWGTRERAGVDLSGLGAREGQLTPQPMLAPTGRDTDAMRFERRSMQIPMGENRPRLRDREVSVLEHGEALEEGCGRLFDLLVDRRAELSAEDGPLAAFAAAPVRTIFRPTAAYGGLLVESCHPHVGGNALEKHRLLDRLWVGVDRRPFLETLIPIEQRELARGDIPRFITRPDSRDVWTGTGERLPAVFDDVGLDRVRHRLARWSDADRRRQQAVIRGSLEVLRLTEGSPQRPSYDFREATEPASRDRLLEAATAVGRRLLDLAFRGPTEALWLQVDHGEVEGWCLAPTGPDLYLGLPGITLFLGYLGELTGDPEPCEVARLALRSQALQIEHEPERVRGVGAFNGWGGVLYGLTHLGVRWGDERLLDEAESHLPRLAELVEKDEMLDLGAGIAGCALSLLALAGYRPSELLRRILRRCGERLLTSARPQERGVGWSMPLAGNRALAGISHGAAGIALALLRLAAVTGDERLHELALQAIEFERGLFSPAEGNWPDLRAWKPGESDAGDEMGDGDEGEGGAGADEGPDAGAESRFMCAWCHGAPGVGLARLEGLSFLDDARVREEIAVAVRTTLAEGFGDNHSLCHGDLGNLSFLLSAARGLEDRELLATVYRRAAGVLAGIEENGWLFGLPGNVETPGLMVGLAGIGWGLARLAAPDRLPEILSLEPPI